MKKLGTAALVSSPFVKVLGGRFPSSQGNTITALGGRKIKELNLMTKNIDIVSCKSWGGGTKALTSRISQIIGEIQPNYIGVYFPHPPVAA